MPISPGPAFADLAERLPKWTPWVLALPLCCLILVCLTARAFAGVPSKHHPTVTEAWQALGSIPWYDVDTQSLRAVRLRQRALPIPPSEWTQEIREDTTPKTKQLRRWGSYFIWTCLVCFTGIVIFWIVHTLLRHRLGLPEHAPSRATRNPAAPSRIEELPFDLGSPRGDPLSLAAQFYQQGAYGPAIQMLLAHMLLQLDRCHRINLAKGKTNRRYLRELRDHPDLAKMLEQAMALFEFFFFGKHTVTQQQFESVWQQIDRFHTLLSDGSPRGPGQEYPRRRSRLEVQACFVLAWTCLLSGCQLPTHDLATAYGQRANAAPSISINGTDVLAKLLERRGAAVVSTRRLGRLTHSADAIIWFPADFREPSPAVRRFFLDWLRDWPDRRLVIVGPSFQAESVYWDAVVRMTQGEQRTRARWEAARAQCEDLERWARADRRQDYGWFEWTLLDNEKSQRLRGPWTQRLLLHDAARTFRSQIVVHSRKPAETERSDRRPTGSNDHQGPAIPEDLGALFREEGGDFDHTWSEKTLLETINAEKLVVEFSRGETDGRVLAIHDGSFLLNFALTDPENHSLAMAVIDYLSAAERVVFLEAGGSPEVVDRSAVHPFLQAFQTRPLRGLLLHALSAGIIAGFFAFPIFGRPRTPVLLRGLDFGDHVRAVGELLRKTGQEQYAREVWDHFRQSG